MSLTPGTRLGPYEVISLIGAGGMGVVYQARDTRLDRLVALKVLPARMAADPDWLARFEREAKLLAALNHPHIAQIYGLEGDGAVPPKGDPRPPVRALVMDLVEGPTLAERIARGVVPVAEALLIAQQLAQALEYAHEHGIVHRDLGSVRHPWCVSASSAPVVIGSAVPINTAMIAITSNCSISVNPSHAICRVAVAFSESGIRPSAGRMPCGATDGRSASPPCWCRR